MPIKEHHFDLYGIFQPRFGQADLFVIQPWDSWDGWAPVFASAFKPSRWVGHVCFLHTHTCTHMITHEQLMYLNLCKCIFKDTGNPSESSPTTYIL